MPLLQEQNIFMAKIIALNKPFGVICQFSGDEKTLAEYIDIPNIYPVGRLDKDSEGLVILTDDGKLQNKISHPKYNKTKPMLFRSKVKLMILQPMLLRRVLSLKMELLSLQLLKKLKSQVGFGQDHLRLELEKTFPHHGLSFQLLKAKIVKLEE